MNCCLGKLWFDLVERSLIHSSNHLFVALPLLFDSVNFTGSSVLLHEGFTSRIFNAKVGGCAANRYTVCKNE